MAVRSWCRVVLGVLGGSSLVLGACSSSTDDATTGPGGSGPSATGGTVVAVSPRPSGGCGAPAQGAVREERRTLDVAGEERWYLLTVPGTHDGTTPLPLVLDFHGLSEGAEIHARMSGYSVLAEQEGFVVAFPNGRGTPVRWDAANLDDNADVDFVDALLDRLGDDLCLDTSRVYATGLSNGALMSSLLACVRSARIAAIVPVAGVAFPRGCAPSRPVPVLAYHGTADPILLFNGGIGDALGRALSGGGDPAPTTLPPADLDGPGYPEAVAAWAAANNCDPVPSDERRSSSVLLRRYACPPGADVVFVVIEGGGHTWPGSEFSRTIEAITGPTSFEVDATVDGWAFASGFSVP